MSKRRVLGKPSIRPATQPTSTSVTTKTPNTNGTSGKPMLACPICNEPMITLNQLNQHLDDEHTSSTTTTEATSTDDNGGVTGAGLGVISESLTNSSLSSNGRIGIDNDFKKWFKKSVIDNYLSPSYSNSPNDSPTNANFNFNLSPSPPGSSSSYSSVTSPISQNFSVASTAAVTAKHSSSQPQPNKLKLEVLEGGNNFTLNTASSNNTPNHSPNPNTNGFDKASNMTLLNDLTNTTTAVQPLPQSLKRQFKLHDKLHKHSNSTSSKENNNTYTHTRSPQRQQLQQTIQIPKDHWMKPTQNQTCCFDGCSRILNIKNGIVNCRKCGKLYCNLHARYRIKINEKLQHDSMNGVWVRCCESCFSNKPGWLSATSSDIVDLTGKFNDLKHQFVGLKLDQLNKSKKLIKLIQYLKCVEDGSKTMKDFQSFEKQLVSWHDDLKNCEVCNVDFVSFGSFFGFGGISGIGTGRHHCRVCGICCCDDLERGCSMDVPVNLIVELLNYDDCSIDEFEELKHVKLRICVECKRKLFNKLLFLRDLKDGNNESIELFNQFKLLKLKFSKKLNDGTGERGLIKAIDCLNKIEKLSKTITTKLSNYDLIINELNKGTAASSLTTTTTTTTVKAATPKIDEVRVLRSLNQSIIIYLQDNLPILRKLQQEKLRQELDLSVTPSPSPSTHSPTQSPEPTIAGVRRLTKKQVRENREKLMVLNEQKFIIEGQYNEFKKLRKFDDLKILESSLNDLKVEIEKIELELGDDGF